MARHRFSPYTCTTGQGSAPPGSRPRDPATRRSGWKSLTTYAAPAARSARRAKSAAPRLGLKRYASTHASVRARAMFWRASKATP